MKILLLGSIVHNFRPINTNLINTSTDYKREINNNKFANNYNFPPDNDLEFTNKSIYYTRGENDRMPSELKQLEKLKNKIKDIETKIQSINKN